MKIFVKVQSNAKKEAVEKLDPPARGLRWAGDAHFVVFVKAPPAGGKANQAVLRLLADYFGVAPSRLKIIAGRSARRKIIQID